MRESLRNVLWAAFAVGAAGSGALGQSTGAKSSGNWGNVSIWTGAAVPNSSYTVYIGSTTPSGSAATATVTLTADESANNVYLGYGSGTSGTLNLAGNTLTIGDGLVIGDNGTGTLNEGGGSFTAPNLYVENGNTFAFGANDVVTNLNLSGGSSATTAATGNVTNDAIVNGGTLTLGANMNLGSGGEMNVYGGSTLNMAGYSLTAASVLFGWNGSGPATLQNLGNITATNLSVGNGTAFNITAADTVGTFNLSGGSSTLYNNVTNLNLTSGATAVTTATGNVTNEATVNGGTLTLGANMNLGSGGEMNVYGGSTLNMAGYSLTANTVYFGWDGSGPATLQNMGNITASNLDVGNGMAFNITAADTVGTFNLSGGSSTLYNNVTNLNLTSGATAVTTATGNVTNEATVNGGTLTLGANMNLGSGGEMNVYGGSTLNMAGYSLTAASVLFGWNGSGPATLQNLGNITATNLDVGNGQAFTFNANDAAANLTLAGGAAATTTAAGNVTASATVETGSTLTLGANLTLSGNLDVQDSGSALNAMGHALTADNLYVGWDGTSAVSFTNLGQVTLSALYMGNTTAGSDLNLHGGDVISSLIDLRNGSALIVDQLNGTGLTFLGTSLTLDPSSIDLVFTLNSSPNWDFRWADPSNGNWMSTLEGMIGSGEIVISSPDGYSVVNEGGYTYIMGGVSAVPEPSSLVLACIAAVGVAAAVSWKSRRSGRDSTVRGLS